jgi:hypothetical protein
MYARKALTRNRSLTPMLQYVIKVALTAVSVVAVAELAKRSSLGAAALHRAAIPLRSIGTGELDVRV